MAISEQDRRELLRLAREAVAAEVSGGPEPTVPPRPGGLLGQRRGCFVTLTNAGRLRGCIGTFQPHLPLGRQVVEMAREAARDQRFFADPVTPAELKDLTVQVSVLSELRLVPDPLDIELGVHGIYVVRGHAAGCFLPEVAAEAGWGKEEFLSHCCAGKAGLAPDAWRQPGTQVYAFTSEKFSE